MFRTEFWTKKYVSVSISPPSPPSVKLGVTHCLETCIISTCTLATYLFFFIANEADIFPLTLPILLNIERSAHFFCLLLFASLILQRGVHNCFQKTSCVTGDLMTHRCLRALVGQIMNYQNTCTLKEFR